MGHVHAEITLKNVYDMGYARDGHIKEEEVRSLTFKAMVDTGATRLCITEEMWQKLGLRIVRSKPVNIANGTMVKSQIAGPVEIIWKNRSICSEVAVLPGLKKPLLGVLPLEAMDLMVNPVTQELVGAHGDEWVEYAMSPLDLDD